MTIATMTGGGGLRARAVTRPTSRRKPVRVAKARWPGVCSRCGSGYSVGMQVARHAADDWGWSHVACLISGRQLQGRARPGEWLTP